MTFLLVLVVIFLQSFIMLTEGARKAKTQGTLFKGRLTINSFEEGGDGGGASKCDENFHSDDTLVVALSTSKIKGRCNNNIVIHANGKQVVAKVVDECDESNCLGPDIVDASKAVWKALGVDENSRKFGLMPIIWNDA